MNSLVYSIYMILGAFAYAFAIIYGSEIHKPFPNVVIDISKEPLTKAIVYLIIFMVSEVNLPAALGLLIATLMVHLDYINIARQPI